MQQKNASKDVCIIFKWDIKKDRAIDYGSIRYHVYPLNMIDIDGYEIIRTLKLKIETNHQLGIEDIVKLELLLMGNLKDKKIFIQSAYDMSLHIESEETRLQAQSIVFGLAEKFKIIIEEELEVIFDMSEIMRRREEKAKIELLQQMNPNITLAEIANILHISVENVKKIVENYKIKVH